MKIEQDESPQQPELPPPRKMIYINERASTDPDEKDSPRLKGKQPIYVQKNFIGSPLTMNSHILECTANT